MIAVDQQGRYHIIDFKTSYKTFVPKLIGANKDIVYDRFSEEIHTLTFGEPRTAKWT